MSAQERFEEFVKFAIDQERAASELYSRTAGIVKERAARTMLEEMAAMERGHEAKLKVLLATGKASMARPGEVKDRAIAEFLVDTKVSAESSVQDVFIFAIKAEQRANELYTYLAAFETDGSAKSLLASMAEEEKAHKRDLEEQYERMFLREN